MTAAESRQDSVSTYDEYLRRYPHPHADAEILTLPTEDEIAEEAERHGRNVLRQAAASLAAQTHPAKRKRK